METNSADIANPPSARVAYAWEVMRLAFEQMPTGALIEATTEINRRLEVTLNNRLEREKIIVPDPTKPLPFEEV